ncbi:MAG: MarR family winged helix-turn-helix transcriptional regulator [Oscillospiraceae bacterium]|jgi:DNA-binding MarR family transcriptional regulator|nr:MarR family winged helix-turn-helix transcriptional regulator [Oscillospiraceae bacterium]
MARNIEVTKINKPIKLTADLISAVSKGADAYMGAELKRRGLKKRCADVFYALKRQDPWKWYGLKKSRRYFVEYQPHIDGTSQKELAALMGVSEAAVSKTLEIMYDEGLVERIRDVKDERVTRVLLSNEGETEAQKTISAIYNIRKDIFAGFTRAELSELCGYLKRVADNLNGVDCDEITAQIEMVFENETESDTI